MSVVQLPRQFFGRVVSGVSVDPVVERLLKEVTVDSIIQTSIL